MAKKFHTNMKKILCVLFLAATWTTWLRAEDTSSADAATVKDGKIYSMQGGNLELLAANIQFPQKIEITTNASFIVADGKERKLLEGQILRRDGWLLNTDGSIEPVFDHVGMKDGKVFLVQDGQAEVLTQSKTFPNKLNINPDGSCNYPDGSRTRLMDGQLFHLDGTPILSKDTITMKNGHVVVQKEGKMIPISPVQIIGMNDGTSVRGDGLLQKRDGTTSQLHEGQTILIDGALVQH